MSTSGNLVGSLFDSSLQADADGNVSITGDLVVSGSTTTVSTSNTTLTDQLIELGSGRTGSASGDAGIIIERGSDTNVFLGFDESEDKVTFATTSATGASTGDLTLTDAALKTGAVTASGDISTTGEVKTAKVSFTDGDDAITIADGGGITANTSLTLASGATVTAINDEDNMTSNSATALATQQSIKAYVDSQTSGAGNMDNWVLEDDDGTEVTVSNGKEVKFIGSGLTTNFTDTDNGTDADPFDLTFTVDAAQTGITSVVNASLEIGRDADNRIKFGTDNQIIFEVDGGDNVIFKTGGEIEAASLDVSGDADIDGTLDLGSLSIDNNVTNTSAGTYTAMTVDFDKTGASTSDNDLVGIFVDMDNTTATGGTNTMTGALITPTLTHASASGTTLVKGLEVTATGSGPGNTTTRALDLTATGADFNQGVFMKIDNGGPDIKMLSSASNSDFSTIATGANGELTISTTDGGGTDGHINLVPDGRVVIGDGSEVDTMLVFDGNAADFRIGIDDSTDTLEIGKGTAHDTDAIIKIKSSTNLEMMLNSGVADGEVSGTLAMFTADEDLTAGEVVYFKSNGKVAKAVATAAATSRCVAMAIAPTSANALGPFLLKGFARFDSEFPTWTVGGALFTPEAETSSKNVPEQTAPDTDGDFVQVIGYAISADAIYFDPDSTVIEVA